MNPLLLSRIALAAAFTCTSAFAADFGRRLPSEKRVYADKVTGARITALTTDPANDAKIYQDHPQWTADGQWIVFRSNRGAPASPPPATPAPGGQPTPAAPPAVTAAFAVNETTGDIVQLTEYGVAEGYSGMLCVAQKSMKLYFLRGTREVALRMIELDLAKLLPDALAGKVRERSAYERICGQLPVEFRDSGGFGLDADEKFAYIGVRGGDTGKHLAPGTPIVKTEEGRTHGGGPGGLRSMNLLTGEVKVIIDTPFQMGHVQTNPWVPGEIVYCHETGGDAPQRIWTVMADGTKNRPLYEEGPTDWVTHEAVITKDEVAFNILGHQARLRAKPSGIAVINLRTNHMKIYGQVEDSPAGGRSAGGYWHCNGSPDGQWLAGDTFAGNVWLIHRPTGTQTLLTTDHKMRPDHAHPTFSPDSKRLLIQSGNLSNGESLDLLILQVPAPASAATASRPSE
jgi:oligogalacturonide lyase